MDCHTPEAREYGDYDSFSLLNAQGDCVSDEPRRLVEDNLKPSEQHRLHPLGKTFVLWYLENQRNRDWKECVKEVGAFNSLQGFYVVNAGMKPPSQLRYGNDYMLFKEGVKPMWEDENNRRGGRWRMSVESRRNNNSVRTDAYWYELMLVFITSTFTDDQDILGIVVNRRAKGDKISVWTRDASNEEVKNRVGQELKKLLLIPDGEKVSYFPHEMPVHESPGSGSS